MNDNKFQLRGRIIRSKETQTKGASGFKTRQFVLECEGEKPEYPHTVLFTLMADKCEEIQTPVGSDVIVDFNYKTKEYNGNEYLNIVPWKVSYVSNTPTQYQPQEPKTIHQAPVLKPQPQTEAQTTTTADDLPF